MGEKAAIHKRRGKARYVVLALLLCVLLAFGVNLWHGKAIASTSVSQAIYTDYRLSSANDSETATTGSSESTGGGSQEDQGSSGTQDPDATDPTVTPEDGGNGGAEGGGASGQSGSETDNPSGKTDTEKKDEAAASPSPSASPAPEPSEKAAADAESEEEGQDEAAEEEHDVFDSKYADSNTAPGSTGDAAVSGFVMSIAEDACEVAAENDLYASFLIAQAIIESDAGNNEFAKSPNNNLFGLQGSYKGKSVRCKMSEKTLWDKLFSGEAEFAQYDSAKESLESYAGMLKSSSGSELAGTWKSYAGSVDDACQVLVNQGYANQAYVDEMLSLIDTYHLKLYDSASDSATRNAYMSLITTACSQLGRDYVWGGSSLETGFDCSGLVQWAYRTALGINLSRTTYTQQYEGEEVPFDELQPGDLLFFVSTEEKESGDGTTRVVGDTHHVAMYIGDGMFIHAPSTGDVIRVTSMSSYTPTFAKRILTSDVVASLSVASADAS